MRVNTLDPMTEREANRSRNEFRAELPRLKEETTQNRKIDVC